MKIVAVRPKRKRKRKDKKVALYTVAFEPGELRQHDSSFSKYCKELCEHRIRRECNTQCNIDGEYGRLLHIWERQGYLIAFFSNQKDKLSTDRYGNITVGQAVARNRIFLNELRQAVQTGDLDDVFQPLYDNEPSKDVQWPESKFKLKVNDVNYENWLRIYAVRFVEKETGLVNYIITGGAIKLVRTMAEFAPMAYEERKQEKVIKYLLDKELTTREEIEKVIL